MHTESEILAACKAHGASAVYAAANARIGGSRSQLAAVGLSAADLAQANNIAVVAFAMLNTSKRAGDLADIAIKGARRP